MGFFGKQNDQRFKVINDRTFEVYDVFYRRRKAKLTAEELKLAGDIKYYRVEDVDDGKFILWIH